MKKLWYCSVIIGFILLAAADDTAHKKIAATPLNSQTMNGILSRVPRSLKIGARWCCELTEALACYKFSQDICCDISRNQAVIKNFSLGSTLNGLIEAQYYAALFARNKHIARVLAVGAVVVAAAYVRDILYQQVILEDARKEQEKAKAQRV